MKINLGCGKDIRKDYLNVDWKGSSSSSSLIKNIDLSLFPWVFQDSSCDEVLMNHVLEHLPNTLATVSEIHRILKSGGIFIGKVPFCFSENAFIEPDHVRYFHPQSFHRLAEIFNFKTEYIKLVCTKPNILYRLKTLIPFKFLFKHFILNVYDEIHFKMIKK